MRCCARERKQRDRDCGCGCDEWLFCDGRRRRDRDQRI